MSTGLTVDRGARLQAPGRGSLKVLFRLPLERCLAHRAAEQVFPSLVLDDDVRFVAVDSLPADGVAVRFSFRLLFVH